MNMMEMLAALERRVKHLESNPAASLRFAEVTEVDAVGQARVKLPDGSDMVSKPLRTVQRRTLKDKDQCFPDLGEHVACLFHGQGLEEGIIIGAVYSKKDIADGQPVHSGYYRYADGTTIYYDRETHKYVMDVKGDIDITCTGNVTATVDGDIDVKAKGQIQAVAGQKLLLQGTAGVCISGPTIAFQNLASGGACKARIEADVDLLGNLAQNGSQTVSNSITAGGAITGNPVNGCVHGGD